MSQKQFNKIRFGSSSEDVYVVQDTTKVALKTVITDTTSTTKTIQTLNGNTNYYFGTLSNLTINNINNSDYTSFVFFKTDNTINVSLPNNIKISNEYNFQPNNDYILQIINGCVIVNQINNIDNPLTFTATQANSTVKLTKVGSTDDINLKYSTDGNVWYNYTIDTVITLTNVNDYVKFYNTNTNFSKDTGNYYKFSMTGQISASGNTNSLINYSNLSDYCYYSMFANCTSLTTAPQLTATTLAQNCYRSMFYGCTELNRVTASFEAWNSDNNATVDWLNGVSYTGVFIKKTVLTQYRGDSYIPQHWAVVDMDSSSNSTDSSSSMLLTGNYISISDCSASSLNGVYTLTNANSVGYDQTYWNNNVEDPIFITYEDQLSSYSSYSDSSLFSDFVDISDESDQSGSSLSSISSNQ